MTCLQLEVLNTLERNDPSGSHHCVALVEWFDYRGHVCMVGAAWPEAQQPAAKDAMACGQALCGAA